MANYTKFQLFGYISIILNFSLSLLACTNLDSVLTLFATESKKSGKAGVWNVALIALQNFFFYIPELFL